MRALFIFPALGIFLIGCSSPSAKYDGLSCDQLDSFAGDQVMAATSVMMQNAPLNLAFVAPEEKMAYIDSLQKKIDDELEEPLREATIIGEVLNKNECFESPAAYESFQEYLKEYEDYDLAKEVETIENELEALESMF